MLDGTLQVEAITPEAEALLVDLPWDTAVVSPALPMPVYEVANRLRALYADPIAPNAPPARLRVRTRSGRWLVLHASRLTDREASASRTAIVIELARPPEIAPVVARAYGFSRRELDVLERVLGGSSMAEIASTLSISTHTVGDYLKAIFDRVGVRSQRELIAHVLGDTAIARQEMPTLPYGDDIPQVAFGR